jgi:hypothetical protein
MSPLRDNALVFNIQLALLGIIMVVGVFYNWRALSRIEERMESLARTVSAGASLHGGAGAGMGADMGMYNDGPVSDEDAEMAEAFMQNVFGNVAYNAASVAAAGGGVPGATVVVEEAAPEPIVAAAPAAPVVVAAPVAPKPAAAPAAAPVAGPVADDVVAAALLAKNEDSGTEDSTVISKTRLRKMNAESLREVCMSHGLPSDGTRVTLIDRLMEFLYD